MSYLTATTFDIGFIERTNAIINWCYSKKEPRGAFSYDFTLLINCLLGLVVLPVEHGQVDNSEKSLKEIISKKPDFESFFSSKTIEVMINNETKTMRKCTFWENGTIENVMDFTYGKVLRHIRNAISHCHIIPVKASDKDKWVGIILNDINIFSKEKEIVMELYLTEQEVKYLADFIVEQFVSGKTK